MRATTSKKSSFTPARVPDNQELHVHILRQLARQLYTTHREFAKQLSVSLGRVNYCINALLAKGWIKAQNFQRSDNKRAYAYLLTAFKLQTSPFKLLVLNRPDKRAERRAT
jgi:hypothetical protein